MNKKLAEKLLSDFQELENNNKDVIKKSKKLEKAFDKLEIAILDELNTLHEDKDVVSFSKFSKLNEGSINYDKWRRAKNGKSIARIIAYLTDSFGNKKRYIANLKYRENEDSDGIYFSELLIGGWKGESGTGFALSNMQNKPKNYFGGRYEELMYFDESEFNEKVIDTLSKNPKETIHTIYGDMTMENPKSLEKHLKDWFSRGVMSVHRFEYE